MVFENERKKRVYVYHNHCTHCVIEFQLYISKSMYEKDRIDCYTHQLFNFLFVFHKLAAIFTTKFSYTIKYDHCTGATPFNATPHILLTTIKTGHFGWRIYENVAPIRILLYNQLSVRQGAFLQLTLHIQTVRCRQTKFGQTICVRKMDENSKIVKK